MGGLLVSGAALNFFHCAKVVSSCKKHSHLEMGSSISQEDGGLPIISKFFELIENDRLLTREEINGVAPLLYFLEKQKSWPENISLINAIELEVVNAVTGNLIKLASRRYQNKISGPTVKFLDYLNHSRLSKNSIVLSMSNLAAVTADFARLKCGSIRKTREIVSDFLNFFENAQSYINQTALDKMLFKLDVISLAAHPGPNIPRLTRNFLYALKENNICSEHPISEIAKAILEEESDLSVIRDFLKLTDFIDLKESVVGFFALLSGKETWVEYIKEAGKSEEKALKFIVSNLLNFSNDQDLQKSKVIINFANYSNQSKFSINQDAQAIAAMILSIENFMKLKIPSDFKNIFLAYLQTDSVPGGEEKEKFASYLKRFANTADSVVARSVTDLLTLLSQAKPWKNHWLSNLAADVLIEKEKNLPTIGAFISFVSKIEAGKKNKITKIEKFALRFSDLLNGKKTKIIDDSLRKQINYLINCLYNQATGEINPATGKAKIVMDFLDDLAKLRKWNDQEADLLALDVVDMVVALRDFLKIKNSSDRKITEEQILILKNSFFTYLQTEADDAPKTAKEKQKLIKFERDLNNFIMSPDVKISGPTAHLITCLNKLEIWGDHRISKVEKYNLKMHAIAPFAQKFSELWTDGQIREYFENHEEGNILKETDTDVKFFLVLLANENMLPILSPEYSKISGKSMRTSLIARLIFLSNDSNKRVSDAALNILNHLKNSKRWEGHPAQEIASTVLLELAYASSKKLSVGKGRSA